MMQTTPSATENLKNINTDGNIKTIRAGTGA